MRNRNIVSQTIGHNTKIAAISAVAAAIIGIGSSFPSYADADLPYCTYSENDVGCDFVTYRQCEASARNVGASCLGNPGYAFSYASADMPVPVAPQTGRVRVASGDTNAIRERCLAQARARYPDSGLGTVTVMNQRTDVYRNCATSNGIRP